LIGEEKLFFPQNTGRGAAFLGARRNTVPIRRPRGRTPPTARGDDLSTLGGGDKVAPSA
jgi:hypothetical protein